MVCNVTLHFPKRFCSDLSFRTAFKHMNWRFFMPLSFSCEHVYKMADAEYNQDGKKW